MNLASFNQLAVFSLATIIVSAILLGLFRLRLRFGLTPLYVTLGVFQPIQVLLAASVYVEILPGVIVSPGSVIMFTATLFTILLVYILEDAHEARKIIYGIMFANLVMSLLMIIVGLQLKLPGTFNYLNLAAELFYQNTRVTLAGTAALFVDVFMIIFVYEAVWHWITKRYFVCIYLTLALVLVFDTLFFATGAFFGQPDYLAILTAGLIGKLIMAVPFALLLTLYLYRGEASIRRPSSFEDIFHALSYRQKYKVALQRSEIAAEDLQISKDRYQHIFNNSPVPLWEEDFSELSAYMEELRQKGVSDFRTYLNDNPNELEVCARKIIIRDVNKETLKLHKAKDKAELLGNLDKIFTERSYDIFKEEVIALAEGQLKFEAEAQVKTLDGEVREIFLKLQVNKKSQTALLATTDITERKRAEENLQKNELLLRLFVEHSPASIAMFDLNMKYVVVSRRFITDYGLDGQNIIGRSHYEIFPEIPERWKEVHRRCLAGAVERAEEDSFLRQDNRKEWIRWEIRPWYEHAGEIGGIILFSEVITGRKQAEEALQESEARYRELFLSNPQPMWVYDLESLAFLAVNNAAVHHYGYSHDEFLSMTIKDIRPPDDLQRLMENVSAVDNGYDAAGIWSHIKKDGSIIHVEIASHTLIFENRQAEMVLAHDVTERIRVEMEREKLQAQLIQAQKLEAIGRLAGGVAHDYNNMLHVITGYTQLAMQKAAADDPLNNDLKEVLAAARRSTDITRQLLAFARKQAINPRVINLNETLGGMLKMLQLLIGEDIDLNWQPSPDQPFVFMDPVQLDQILANLCVNARDAIAGVGKLTIEADIVSLDEDYCAGHPGYTPGNFVMLAVSDDGCGMDKDTLDQAFEPFFTTKGTGEGTGLGLSTVYGIVKQNNGFVNVYSETEKGTTFKIYLPLYEWSSESQSVETGAMDIPLSRGETVMVVEDEPSILKLAQTILQNLNYTVLSANTPGRAIDMARQHAGEIHLLVTDVVMPEMNGRDLAEQLQILYPDIKVLFMSGYTSDIIAQRGMLGEGVNFLQKPISNRALAVKVRTALDENTV